MTAAATASRPAPGPGARPAKTLAKALGKTLAKMLTQTLPQTLALPMTLPLALAGLLASTGAAAEPARYVLDPTHTFITFEVLHFGTSTNRGRIGIREGQATLEPGVGGTLALTIDLTTLNTGVEALTRHLRSSDFFDTARQPTARYEAAQLQFDGERLVAAQGQLTLSGQTHPLTLTAQRYRCYTNPMTRRETCGGDFEATLQRSQWGLSWGLNYGFEDQVRLLVQVEGQRQP